MQIVFATWPEAEYQRRRLTEEGGNMRLLSYFFMKQQNPDMMRQYVLNDFDQRKGKRQRGWDKETYRRRRKLAVLARAKQVEP